MRVEVMGGMGVGKTTLCTTLERQGFRCIYETLAKNPYLELSYEDPESFGFYSQISFILGNFFNVTQSLKPGDVTVFDYSTVTDRAYATLFLKDHARDIALQTIDFLEKKEGMADLLIYLTCSPEVQMDRIKSRNRKHETDVDLKFIEQLDGYLRHFAQEAEKAGANILVIDTEQADLRNDKEFVSSLGMYINQQITSIMNNRYQNNVKEAV
jgi:deoxyadenosine/deoxycytidine kinase